MTCWGSPSVPCTCVCMCACWHVCARVCAGVCACWRVWRCQRVGHARVFHPMQFCRRIFFFKSISSCDGSVPPGQCEHHSRWQLPRDPSLEPALSPGDCASCPSLSCCLCRGAHLSLFPELGIEMRTLGTPGALVQGHGLPEGPRPPHQPSPHPDCVLGTLWASGSYPTACTGESERWVETSHL